jgi:glutathione S-transferase
VSAIRLYQFAPDYGLESASSFCVKVQRALQLQGLAYEAINVSPPDIPKLNPEAKKLPVVEIEGRRVIDSTQILRAIDALSPDPSLYPEAGEARALDHLLEDWADESLYWFAVHQRWVVDAHFEAFAEGAFGRMPAPLKWLVPPIARRTAKTQVLRQGLGRLSNEQVLRKLDEHLTALDARLSGGGFLVDDHIRASDIAVFAPLRSLLVPYMKEPRDLIHGHGSVVAWMRRIDDVTRPEKSEAVTA